ncbi:MAG: hypothetical protein JWO33_215, partial [Caulobacteraceae bacterium]|nr:hypothetical protein [Caulobacteraceae bacterium]
MNKLQSAAVLAVLGVSLATTAYAQDAGASGQDNTGWYVRGDVGAAFSDRINGTPEVRGKTGWTVDGAVGRRFGNGFRADAELGYIQADQKAGLTGQIKTFTGLVNGFYDL